MISDFFLVIDKVFDALIYAFCYQSDAEMHPL